MDHYPYSAGSPARRINCKSGRLATNLGGPDANGTCSNPNLHGWPTAVSFTTHIATTHYPESDSTCGGDIACILSFPCKNGAQNMSCAKKTASNYAAATPMLSFGTPLAYAERLRSEMNRLIKTPLASGFSFYQEKYCNLVASSTLTVTPNDLSAQYCLNGSPFADGPPIPATEFTPRLNSSWRSPEHNESALGSAINSNHQYGAALDLDLVYDGFELDFPENVGVTTGSSTLRRVNKLHWCTFAKAAFDEGNAREILIEDAGTPEDPVIFTFSSTSQDFETCYKALQDHPNLPTHLHAAKK